MNEHLSDIVNRLASQITEREGCDLKRTTEAKAHFLKGIEHLIIQLWKGTRIHDGYEGSFNKRADWYSENSRYRDTNLTFKQTLAAYEGLIKLGLVQEIQKGYFHRENLERSITRFAANDELLSIFSDIKEDPFKAIQPDLFSESIILRDTIDGKTQQIDYLDTPGVKEMRDNLLIINKCLNAHYPDIRVRDDDWLPLQERIMADPKKQPIDLTRRTLVRIFSEGRFDRGGRFYRGWWQYVPSEDRPYITIAGKKTCEYDFSQLNPHMVYFLRDKELGSEDAYDRVFDCDHRDLVKEGFSAMMQSSTPLLKEPEDIDLSGVDFDWPFLRQAIIDAHKPIQDMFFKGHGNYLQYVDSAMAEEVMLRFAKSDYAPLLPIHDSFIMQHAFGESDELEEDMRRAFYGHFKKDIKIDDKIGVIFTSRFDEKEWSEPSFGGQFPRQPEYSQWENRNN
jgi:hypothetical protein